MLPSVNSNLLRILLLTVAISCISGCPLSSTQNGSEEFFVEDYPEGVYVLGKTRDFLRYKNVPNWHPQTLVLHYMKLRIKEEDGWKDNPPLDALRSEDSTKLDRITDLLRNAPLKYSNKDLEDFVDFTPCNVDQSWIDLCRFYRNATRSEREYIRSQIDENSAWHLLTFSKRAAISGLREKSLELIRDSLIAHAIEDLRWGDVRDNFVALGLIYYCARKNRAHPDELFKEMAEITGPGMSLVLTDFYRRDDLGNILEEMGWQEVSTANGAVGFNW